jgi:hypothetical protein
LPTRCSGSDVELVPRHGEAIAGRTLRRERLICGSMLANRDADQRALRMELRLGGTDVGSLLDELRRESHRLLLRQLQIGELESFRWHVGGGAAEQRCKLVTRLGQRFLQAAAASRALLRQRGFLLQDRGVSGGADHELPPLPVELFAFDLDDLLRRSDLAAQGSLPHRRRHDIGCRGKIGGFELEALVLGLRLQ